MHCVFPNCGYDARLADLQDITLYKFPEEPYLRMAWLEALGKVGWEDFEDSAICSKHFLTDDFLVTRGGRKLKADAVPVVTVQVCRICLNKDCKLYPMNDDMQLDLARPSYAMAYETLTGLVIEQRDKLPPYLCIKCANRLLSCVRFKTSCIRAHSILMEIVNDYDCITLESILAVTKNNNPFILNVMQNQNDSENMDSETTRTVLKEEDITYADIKTESIEVFDHDILITDVRSTKDKERSSNLDGDNGDVINEDIVNNGATTNDDDTMCPSTRSRCGRILDNLVISESNDVIYQSNRELHEDSVKEKPRNNNDNRLHKDRNIRGSQKEINRGSDKDKDIRGLHKNKDIRGLRKDNVRRSREDNVIRRLHKDKDIKELRKDNVLRESHEDNVIRGLLKDKVRRPHKDKDIRRLHKEKDIRPHKDKIIKELRMDNVRRSHEDNVIRGLHKDKDTTEPNVNNDKTGDIFVGEDSSLNLSIPTEKARRKDKPCPKSKKISSGTKEAGRKIDKRDCKQNGNSGLLLSFKLLSCDVCNYRTISKLHLLRHLDNHETSKFYNCNECDFLTTCKKKLELHTGIHSNGTRHSCNICEKTFTFKKDLLAHSRIHSGEKPYSCDICYKKFIQFNHLKAHSRIHSGERPYPCTVCKKAFRQKGQLQNHLRVHSGEKPYACDLCSKAFVQRGQLQNHLQIHSREKPYTCDVCGKSFSVKSGIYNHLRVHADKTTT